jgi:cytochrome P450
VETIIVIDRDTLPEFPMPRSAACPFDPPPAITELSAQPSIGRVRTWDGSTPWLITRHPDVRTIFADPRFSSDQRRPGYPSVGPGDKLGPDDPPSGSFLTMDGTEHAGFRRKLIGEFTVRRIEALRPRVVEIVDGLLAELAAGPRPADLVSAFALPLPSLVICELLGVPYADHEFFQQHSRDVLETNVGAEQTSRALVALLDYLKGLVKAKEAAPGDDLLSRLITTCVTTGELTSRDVVGIGILLLVAGHETTANMISLGVLTLLRHPDHAALLRSTTDPTVINSAVEELLRLLTITHVGARRAAIEDVQLGEVVIKAGEGVILAGNAANRDPAVFENPDEFDAQRGVNHHVAFGFGPHQCLGQPLARLELQIVYPALLRAFPDLALAVDFDELSFRHEMPMYGVAALPVSW